MGTVARLGTTTVQSIIAVLSLNSAHPHATVSNFIATVLPGPSYVTMFLRRLSRRSLKNERKKKKKSAEEVKTPPVIVEPIYYEEPASDSVESSEVEYIEDDIDHVAVNDATSKIPATGKDAKTDDKDGGLPFLSVCVRAKEQFNDDDSCLSHDRILTKLPPHLEEKSHRFSTKLAGSITSEGHLTQDTCSETCASASMASDKHESKEKKRLEDWRQVVEDTLDEPGEQHPRSAASLLELGTMYLQYEVSIVGWGRSITSYLDDRRRTNVCLQNRTLTKPSSTLRELSLCRRQSLKCLI